jgi:hypothetical protein
MMRVIGTLPFLATLWLLVVLGAAILEESGGKIAAALKGVHVQSSVRQPAVRHRPRPKVRRLIAAGQPRRAAA